MKLLIVCAVLACAYATPVYECTRGPSYWCTNIRVAKACGAVDHCIDTVWRHQKVEQVDGDAVCDFCQGVVSQVKSLLLSNETEGRIHSYLTKACALIPEKFMSNKCQEVVDHYEAEIIKMIQAKLDPVVVCEAAGLCMKGFEDHMPRPETRLPLKVGNATDCADCTKFMTDVVAKLTDKSTEKQIISLIEQNVCSQLGAAAALCNQVVETYADQIVAMITEKVKPGEVCKAFGFCNGSRAILVAMKLEKTKLYKEVHKKPVNACEICDRVVTLTKVALTVNFSKAEIEQFIETELCDRLGSLASACKQGVEEFGPVLFELLANELDPDTICKAIGLCPAANKSSIPAFNMRPATVKLIKTSVGKKDSPQCTLCEFAMQQLETKLASNATEQEIITAVEQVCTLLPSTVSATCQQLVAQYGPTVIAALISQVKPAQVCTFIGLCTPAGAVPEIKRPVVKATPQCVLCEFVMTKLDTILESNATQQEIIAAVEQVCALLPSTISTECKSFVDQYGPAAIAAIVGQLKPDQVCTFLGLCTARQFVPMKPAPADQTCTMCEQVIAYTDSILADNATVQEIIATVEKVCNFVPADMKAQCDNVIAQYGEQLIEAYLKMTPDQVCQAIGLCPPKVNRCSWGPTYWCASKANAKKCKAENHCRKHVWVNVY